MNPTQAHPRTTARAAAFTLLEVLIAMGIFALAIFAILDLVNQNLRAARLLQPHGVDPTLVIQDLMLTNRLEEFSSSGNFGKSYPGYSWTRDIYLVSTNGLFEVDVAVFRDGGGENGVTKMSLLMFRPASIMKAGFGGGRGLQRMGGGQE
jgi:general secretion pathway protein I